MLDQPVRRVELAKALAQFLRNQVLIEVTQNIARAAGLLDGIEAVDRKLGQQGANRQAHRRADRLLGCGIQIPTKDGFFDEAMQADCIEEPAVLDIRA